MNDRELRIRKLELMFEVEAESRGGKRGRVVPGPAAFDLRYGLAEAPFLGRILVVMSREFQRK
jgi:hypothetical protein